MRECLACDLRSSDVERCPFCGALMAPTRRPGELFDRPSERWPVTVTRTTVFGASVLVFDKQGGWWWRVEKWRPFRRPVGVFNSRAEAVRDAAISLFTHPGLREARD